MPDKQKYLVIVNFDLEIGIVFSKFFKKDSGLRLKKLMKGTTDEALNFAYDIASKEQNEINYQIVVNQEGVPVCFEAGYVTPEGDLIPQRSEEEPELNANPAPQGDEEVKKNVKDIGEAVAKGADELCWWLDIESVKDKEATLYLSHPETEKSREYYGSSAIKKAKELVKNGICVALTIGGRKPKNKKDGFLKLIDGQFVIEMERTKTTNKIEPVKI